MIISDFTAPELEYLRKNCNFVNLEREGLKLKAIDYDLDAIYLCQDELHEKYKHKTEKIGVNIC